MNQLNDWIKRLPDINSRISIVLILLLLVVLMYILFSNMKQQGRNWGEQWTKPITEYSKAVDEMLNNAKINKGTQEQQSRLKQQIDLIQSRAEVHKQIMIYLYTRYFTSIVMVATFGVILAVLLLYGSINGVRNLPLYLLAILYFVLAGTLYWGSFPLIFKQDENIAKNKELYLSYIGLENQILSYLSTDRIKPDDEDINIREYILILDVELNKLNKLPLGFEPPEAKDYFEQAGELTGQ